MNSLIGLGATQLFRGARRGRPATAGLGAALLLVGLARRYSGKSRKLLFARTLKDGEQMTVTLLRGGND